MHNAYFDVPVAKNEPVYSYAPNTPERAELQKALEELRSQEVDVPMYIGGDLVYTDDKRELRPPHDIKHKLGTFNYGTKQHVEAAINSALEAREKWAALPWDQRASIFLKAADLISGPYRYIMNAGTMLAQSKNAYQSEIDAVAELADFLRFNVQYMTEIYKEQPESAAGTWNRLEYRPLEGFVFAITPFNFTAIAGNLPMAAVVMGNVCVWKPADTQVYSANLVMEIFREAGLPDGVINMITVDGPDAGEVIFKHKDFAGLHFTGSTKVFKNLWKTIANNLDNYRTYPRIVGETGGKDYIIAHHSARAEQVATALVRGAFEFQGQKCSACSRAYIPKGIWSDVNQHMMKDLASIKMGPTEDFSNFVNAVIDERAFDRIAEYIKYAKSSPDAEVIAGGNCNKTAGYFIEPTVIVAKDPKFRTMCEEIFGPVLTIYVYEDEHYSDILKIADETSEYGLTGSIISQDRYAIDQALKALENSAGNFYINDKCTGAVVGQQPFGGARGSGTNDKAGSKLNLLRWVSPRMVKETFVTPVDYRYPFLG